MTFLDFNFNFVIDIRFFLLKFEIIGMRVIFL